MRICGRFWGFEPLRNPDIVRRVGEYKENKTPNRRVDELEILHIRTEFEGM